MALKTIQFTVQCFRNVRFTRHRYSQTIISKQPYSRWTHRRPTKIANEKEIFGDTDRAVTSSKFLTEAKFTFNQRQKLREPIEKAAASEAVDLNPDGTLNDDGTPIFTKLDRDDRIMSSLMLMVKSRKKQKKEDKVLLEGYRLIQDAINTGHLPEFIIFSRKPDLARLTLPKNGVKLYKIPYQTIQLWSDLTTSPGIMGIFPTPDVSRNEPADDHIPTTVICDNVREPGNLGSILRVAAGVGCERVILTKGCVDLWSPKVLRSAAGSHFRLQIHKAQTWAEIQHMINEDADVFVADNKAHELSDAVSETTQEAESSDSDSQSSDSDSSDSSDSESEVKENKADNETKNIVKKIHKDFGLREAQKKMNEDYLPVIPYFSAEYTQNETIIIVGGETEGLSDESLALAERKQGIRINVPLTNGVESLNTGTALGILLFEIKRQFLTKLKKQ